jgi:hypothetical protein
MCYLFYVDWKKEPTQETTLSKIFFCASFLSPTTHPHITQQVYPKFVFTPKTKEELVELQAAYGLLGLPGAIGSMDVVHVAWCMCPAFLALLCTGKEGIPTIAYNVISDHEGRALAVLKGSYGSIVDKTIVRFDDFVEDIRCDPFFTEFKYEVRTGPEANDREMLKGAYLIIDGGYHPWEATQAASRLCTDDGYPEWRKQMESVRKDIECFFGRLKARFRFLKTPISFHKKDNIDDAFFTCVAVQNILHDWDKETGMLTSWEVDAAWGDDGTGSGGHFVDEEGDGAEARLWCRPKLRRARKVTDLFTPQATDDFSDFGAASMPIGAAREIGDRKQPGPGEKQRYAAKQAKLVKHFSYAKQGGSVSWLRS